MKWVKLSIAVPETDFVGMVKVEGEKLCLVKHQGEVYVVQNSCPHAGGILSGGWCKEGHLICPVHRWGYDLKTGRGCEGQGDYIKIYPTEVRPDGIYVGLKQSLWKRFFS